MKVKELIEKLQQLDQDAVVVHHGYEDGYNEVPDYLPREATVFPRYKEEEDDHWWNGNYEEIPDWDDYSKSYYDQDKPLRVVIV